MDEIPFIDWNRNGRIDPADIAITAGFIPPSREGRSRFGRSTGFHQFVILVWHFQGYARIKCLPAFQIEKEL